MKKISFKVLIVLLFVMTGLLPVVGLGAYTITTSRTEIRNEVFKQNAIFIENADARLTQYFDDLKHTIEFLRTINGIIDYKKYKPTTTTTTLEDGTVVTNVVDDSEIMKETAEHILEEEIENSPFEIGFLTDVNGIVTATSDEAQLPLGTDLGGRPYIGKSMNGIVNYSNLFVSSVSGKAALVLSSPVFDYDHSTILGSVNLVMESDVINEIVHQGLDIIGDSTEAYLVGSDGLLMSDMSKDSTTKILETKIDSELVNDLKGPINNRILDYVHTYVTEGYNGNTVLASSAVVVFGDTPVGLIVEVSEDEALLSIRDLQKTTLLFVGGLLLFGIVMAFFIVRFISKPLEEMTVTAQHVADGDINVDLGNLVKRKDAIGKLAQAFAQVVRGNKVKSQMISDMARGDLDNIQIREGSKDAVFVNIGQMRDTLVEFKDRIQDTSANITLGYLKNKVDTEGLEGVYEELAQDVNIMTSAIVRKIDALPMPVLAISDDFKIRYGNSLMKLITGIEQEDLVGLNCYDIRRFDACNNGDGSCSCGLAMKSNDVNTGQTQASLDDGSVFHMQYTGTPMHDRDGNVVGVIETATDLTLQVEEEVRLNKRAEYQDKYIKQLLSNINELAKGSFNITLDEFKSDKDTDDINETFKEINFNLGLSIGSISSYVTEISTVLGKLSNSDLDVEVTREYLGDFESIKHALNDIIDSFNGVITNIYHTSNNVSSSARHMSDSSNSLSSGSTEQAASIEEISATVTQVAAQVQENAKNAKLVSENAEVAAENVSTSSEVMHALTASMKEIQKSTSSIQKVLKMINDIAFQTNILSLNAAVEAARAGQHGKGFAVIAEDVRNLALKSASAADETSDMLDGIVAQINESVEYAKQTDQALDSIKEGSKESVIRSTEVANASSEQAVAINQITLSLDQISQVVQSTSVNAQQSAQTSKELEGQAKGLMKLVSEFNIKDIDTSFIEDVKEETSTDLIEDEPIIHLDLDDF
jgi:methyl-accepting chemotaxis protein